MLNAMLSPMSLYLGLTALLHVAVSQARQP